jgi:hypothetical protein
VAVAGSTPLIWMRPAPETKPDTVSCPSPWPNRTVTAAPPWMETASSPWPARMTALEKDPS